MSRRPFGLSLSHKVNRCVMATSPKRTAAKKSAAPAKELGELPEWNLDDLYAGLDVDALV